MGCNSSTTAQGASAPSAKLYTPLKVGSITINNRMVMGPLTRCRANNNAEHKATDLMVEYYTQRATAGLIITECTSVCPNTSAFYAEPGIYEDAQIEGWKKVTDSVHAAGGKIILQIWHGGRACPSEYNGGQQPVAPSAIAIAHRYQSALQQTLVPNDVPRALTDEEAKDIVKSFAEGAKRAIAAGFDGVEIHGANGYLINQFLCASANKRGPESYYSGETIETRARFALDVVDAVSAAIGKERVGIRLSPYVNYNEAKWEDPQANAAYIAGELNKRGIAFVHVMRRDMMTPGRDQTLDIVPLFKKHFNHEKGVVLANIDFERAEAEKYVEDGSADAIAIGLQFLTNPDLVRRYKEGRDERNVPDMNTFYAPGPKGYTDYPTLE